MGLTYGKLVIKNARRPELQPMEVSALADTGSNYLCIPAHVQSELQLEELERRDVVLADGTKKSLPYVGPIELHFKNRSGFFVNRVRKNTIKMSRARCAYSRVR